MKKLFLLFVATAAMTMVSCNNNTQNTSASTPSDSVTKIENPTGDDMMTILREDLEDLSVISKTADDQAVEKTIDETEENTSI